MYFRLLGQNSEFWRNEQTANLAHVVRNDNTRDRQQGKEKARGVVRRTENETPNILSLALVPRLQGTLDT